jgi:hypothetical protein
VIIYQIPRQVTRQLGFAPTTRDFTPATSLLEPIKLLWAVDEVGDGVPLRGAEAVEAAGIICPLRITEIGRAGREGVGLHRLPDGIGKIRAGFHHDRLPTGPVDISFS